MTYPRQGLLAADIWCLLLLLIAYPALASGTFRAGAHEVEITPRHFPVAISGGFLAGALEGKTPLPLKTWLHVALVRERDSVRVYLGGIDTRRYFT